MGITCAFSDFCFYSSRVKFSDGTPEVTFIDQEKFIRQLSDLYPIHQIVTRLAIEYFLVQQGLGLAKTSWLKSLGAGLWEFRIGPSIKGVLKKVSKENLKEVPNSKILIRVFVSFKDGRILLISCYDKLRNGGGTRQEKAIKAARLMLLIYQGRS